MRKQIANNLYIVWKEGYELGIPIIDEQHRAIVSTINTFHYFTINGMAEKVLKPTFISLKQYAKTHFLTEERILKKTEYPDIDIHNNLHNELMKKMTDIARKSLEETDSRLALNFLRKWWLYHIRQEDTKFAAHVKKIMNSEQAH